MPNVTQQTLLTTFNQVAGNQSTGQPATIDQGLIDALGQVAQVIDEQTQATSANTEALAQNSQGRGSNTERDMSDIFSTASQFLGGGLSALPLVSLFTSLFGGDGPQQSAVLAPYSLPHSLNLQSTTSGQDLTWGENGLPRASGDGEPGASPQITVQVQAMDSQSFLDHSEDIAQAVRQAMLNMSPVNDVITNL